MLPEPLAVQQAAGFDKIAEALYCVQEDLDAALGKGIVSGIRWLQGEVVAMLNVQS